MSTVRKSRAGKKMQDVDFRDVDELLDYLPDDQREIVVRLRRIILDCVPDLTEKLSYNVPYYRRFRNIVFIWPGAVAWGKLRWEGVQLGFAQGYLLQDDSGFLELGNRKQVAWHLYRHWKEIDPDLVRAFVMEAAVLDEERQRQRRKK